MSGELLSVEAAQATVLAGVGPIAELESVAPEAALGRVLAETVTAATSLPPWDNSAMDGYAIRAADTAGASETEPVRLTVGGEGRAGGAPDVRVPRRTAGRVATRAPLPPPPAARALARGGGRGAPGPPAPPGGDAAGRAELPTPIDANGGTGARGRDAAGPLPAACLVHAVVAPGDAIRRAGSDIEAGTVVAV